MTARGSYDVGKPAKVAFGLVCVTLICSLTFTAGKSAMGAEGGATPRQELPAPTQSVAPHETDAPIPALEIGDLYALLVGVSRYKNSAVPSLTVAAKDARDFATFLETQSFLFRNVYVTLLTDEKATKAEVEKHLFYELRKAGKKDTIVLFFSGHGGIDPKRPGHFFFLTHDADPSFLEISAVNMSGLVFLKELDCPRVVLVADACHAGGFSRLGTKALIPMRTFFHDFSSSSGRVIISSSRPDEYSLEGRHFDNGIFTYHLLQGLKGAADHDANGVITVNEAYNYAYEKTKSETEGVQHPQFEGTIEGIFPLSVADDFGSRPKTVLELLIDQAGAEVLVNGRLVGLTHTDGSLQLRYLPTDRPIKVKVRKDGWATTELGTFVFSEERLRIIADRKTLKPALASLEVRTEPGRVNVAIDGRRAGVTTHDGLLLVHGVQVAVPHALEFTRDGYRQESQIVTIPQSYEGKRFEGDRTRMERSSGPKNVDQREGQAVAPSRPPVGSREDSEIKVPPVRSSDTPVDVGEPSATKYLHFDH